MEAGQPSSQNGGWFCSHWQGKRRCGALIPALLVAVLELLVFSTLVVASPSPTADVAAHPGPAPGTNSATLAAVQPADADCETVGAVPGDECRALVALYNATDGVHWYAHDGWLAFGSDAPCGWQGVTCAGGHVAGLALAGNGLRGTVPAAICALAENATADLGYNSLAVHRRGTKDCLDALDPDWMQTQTVAPGDLTVTAYLTDVLELAWSPIPYSGDGGYYEISYALSSSGPFTTHGQTADKTVSGYRLDGLQPGRTYFVRLRTYTPANSHLPQGLHSDSAAIIAVTRAAESVLLAVSFAADNDLSVYIPTVLKRLREGTAVNPNVQVVFLSDGRADGDTQVRTIREGTVSQTDAVTARWGTQELDMADPDVLAWFLEYARTHYPAAKQVVSLMGHGLPLAPELDWPSAPPGVAAAAVANGRIPPLPQQWDDTPGDVTDRSYMSVLDVGRALAMATDQGAQPFDLIFFDQCFQGNLDTLYQIRSAADVFITSATYAWLAAPYAKYVTQLTPAATSEEMADAIVRIYQGTLTNQHPNAIFAVHGADVSTIAAAVSELGTALRQAVQSEQADVIAAIDAASVTSQYVDTNQCEQPEFTFGQDDELVGIGSFATNLTTAFPTGDEFGVHQAANKVLAALQKVHGSARLGRPYLAPDVIWAYDDTLTVLAPLGRETPPEIAWRTSLYRETSGYTATWTLVPTQTTVVSGALAFVQDGTWDEFLTAWYTQPLTPTVGPWCHYIPPAQVTVDDTELLSLTVEMGSDGVNSFHLAWTATSDERADSYWLFAWRPQDVSWTIADVLPLSQTTYEQGDLRPGTYRFAVLARDASGQFVAQSNAAAWTVARRRTLFLPFVQR